MKTTWLPVCLLLITAGCARPDPAADPPAAPPAGSADEIRLPPDSPQLRQLTVQAVEEAPMPAGVITAPGKIEANPNRTARVTTPLPGKVVSVSVRIGDAVTQGQPLVTIESAEADQAVADYLQAEAAASQQKAGVLKAQADLDRMKDLLEHEAVARKEVLNAENAFVQATTLLEQSRAVREQALRRLEILGLKPGVFGQPLTLKAPVSGKVIEMNVVPGEFRNDTNQPLMTIADLATVWVVSDVPEADIRLIRIGERVELELSAFPGQVMQASVRRIDDSVDPTTRTIKVRAELNNPGGDFRPEMFGRIRHVNEMKIRPVVPASALVQGEGQPLVYQETAPGVFKPVPVVLGEREGERVAIASGLRPGDRIVVDGAMLLKNR